MVKKEYRVGDDNERFDTLAEAKRHIEILNYSDAVQYNGDYITGSVNDEDITVTKIIVEDGKIKFGRTTKITKWW